nr:hypothetical protein [uncultured Draconibacterium sp.]
MNRTALIILSIILIFSLTFYAKLNSAYIKHKNINIILQQHIENSLKHIEFNDHFIISLMSIDLNKLNTKDVYNDGIKYLLLISRAGCSACNKRQIKFVENYNKLHSSKIGVVFSNETIRRLQMSKITNEIESKVFLGVYDDTVEEVVQNAPILVELNESGNCTRKFQPIQELPNFTEKFLELGNTRR